MSIKSYSRNDLFLTLCGYPHLCLLFPRYTPRTKPRLSRIRDFAFGNRQCRPPYSLILVVVFLDRSTKFLPPFPTHVAVIITKTRRCIFKPLAHKNNPWYCSSSRLRIDQNWVLAHSAKTGYFYLSTRLFHGRHPTCRSSSRGDVSKDRFLLKPFPIRSIAHFNVTNVILVLVCIRPVVPSY